MDWWRLCWCWWVAAWRVLGGWVVTALINKTPSLEWMMHIYPFSFQALLTVFLCFYNASVYTICWAIQKNLMGIIFLWGKARWLPSDWAAGPRHFVGNYLLIRLEVMQCIVLAFYTQFYCKSQMKERLSASVRSWKLCIVISIKRDWRDMGGLSWIINKLDVNHFQFFFLLAWHFD